MNNAQQLQEQVSKEVEKQAMKVRGYQGDLQSVQKAANEAQGKWQVQVGASFFLIRLQRLSDERRRAISL